MSDWRSSQEKDYSLSNKKYNYDEKYSVIAYKDAFFMRLIFIIFIIISVSVNVYTVYNINSLNRINDKLAADIIQTRSENLYVSDKIHRLESFLSNRCAEEEAITGNGSARRFCKDLAEEFGFFKFD